MDNVKCPHCGQVLEIRKALVDTVKPLDNQEKADLGYGVLKSVEEAIDAKMNQSLGALARFGQKVQKQTSGETPNSLGGQYLQQIKDQLLVKERMMANGELVQKQAGDVKTQAGNKMALAISRAFGFGKG